MAPYCLRPHLSYCQVEGHLIFLDIDNDQYFRLSAPMECAFVSYMEGSEILDVALRTLVERKILIESSPLSTPTPAPPPNVERPAFSAMEQWSLSRQTRLRVLPEVITTVCCTQLKLKTTKLTDVVSALTLYRRKRCLQGNVHLPFLASENLLDATSRFARARQYVPVERCCLLDSLALVNFLARRGLHANIVFGVTGDPFSAHCWVQVGKLVLNDTVGSVNSFTPIRIV